MVHSQHPIQPVVIEVLVFRATSIHGTLCEENWMQVCGLINEKRHLEAELEPVPSKVTVAQKTLGEMLTV